MTHVKRWMVALAALLVGGGVSAALLVAADPDRNAIEVYATTRGVPAGAAITGDVLWLQRVNVAGGTALFFTRNDEQELVSMRAAHDLSSGQLIQRSDVTAATSAADRRLVFIPVKDAPPAAAGSRVDILVIRGSADSPVVEPFALGVEVKQAATGGIVVAVPSRQAAAFVFAASAMRMVVVVAEAGAADGAEASISSPDQAIAVAAGR
ncbi:MAG TPA: SAF domain-containing protein [Candidatus Dormibacteraeota bacterium]